MIRELLERNQPAQRNNTPRDYFYVSEVADCKRKIYYSMNGIVGEKASPKAQRIMDNGRFVHQRILNALYKAGVVAASEVSISSNDLFRGRADAIISIDDHENIVLEIKSVNPNAFARAPPDSHITQLQLYLHFLKLQRGILLLENKADQELKEILVAGNPSKVARIIADFRELKKLIAQNQPPERVSNWRCNYCCYQKICLKK